MGMDVWMRSPEIEMDEAYNDSKPGVSLALNRSYNNFVCGYDFEKMIKQNLSSKMEEELALLKRGDRQVDTYNIHGDFQSMLDFIAFLENKG